MKTSNGGARAARRAPCILIEGRRPRCPQMPPLSRSESAGLRVARCTSSKDCGAGYCDESNGQCMCPPGWGGDRCEWSFLGACRMSGASTHMVCHGFVGVMSCECYDQCFATMGADSVNHKICFEGVHGDRYHLSDAPPNLSAVRFLRPSLIPNDDLVKPRGWDIVSSSSDHVVLHAGWRSVQVVSPRRAVPLPNHHCPQACSHVGTCVATRPALVPKCQCHAGFYGAACEASNASHCMNGCTRHGQCAHRLCQCSPGWYGLDCSLHRGAERLAPALASGGVRFAPTYVYPLPTEWSGQYVGPEGRSLWSAGRLFVELLHSRRDAIVSNPDEAVLFFVPVVPNHIGGNLWDPRQYLAHVVRFIASRYPFWNRTGGADHIFFTSQDMGGCWVPSSLRQSIVVSHFGFTASEGLWMNATAWGTARKDRRIRYDTFAQPACYTPNKDVVAPVLLEISNADLEGSKAQFFCECEGRGQCHRGSKTLLFMSGLVLNSAPWYSQGVRFAFYELHRHTPGVRYSVDSWSAADLRNATFCLAPSGWGYGWRTYIALAVLCIPVIVQPLVQQAYHDLLPYSELAMQFEPADLERLPELLRAVGAAEFVSKSNQCDGPAQAWHIVKLGGLRKYYS
ncbi:hypothetical protein AB1Y20_020015 [Prymnesium parvum]|uniref:EGF-like domain-containing protein n=1 Tax=Prymnesium parvum TaxID=97485 RepID=A0AB34JXJ4_PRYPA